MLHILLQLYPKVFYPRTYSYVQVPLPGNRFVFMTDAHLASSYFHMHLTICWYEIRYSVSGYSNEDERRGQLLYLQSVLLTFGFTFRSAGRGQRLFRPLLDLAEKVPATRPKRTHGCCRQGRGGGGSAGRACPSVLQRRAQLRALRPYAIDLRPVRP